MYTGVCLTRKSQTLSQTSDSVVRCHGPGTYAVTAAATLVMMALKNKKRGCRKMDSQAERRRSTKRFRVISDSGIFAISFIAINFSFITALRQRHIPEFLEPFILVC